MTAQIPSANDAAWELVRIATDNGMALTQLQVQKVLYLAQGRRLARSGKPLFLGQFEAWEHGPVVPDVHREFTSYGARPVTPKASRAGYGLDDEGRSFLWAVWYDYKDNTGSALRKLTHTQGAAWSKARGDLPPDARSSNVIPDDEIAAESVGREELPSFEDWDTLLG